MPPEPVPIPVPKPSGKISFLSLTKDLAAAYRNAPPDSDPWRAVAAQALCLVPITVPDEVESS
jgi:hypothetical protein